MTAIALQLMPVRPSESFHAKKDFDSQEVMRNKESQLRFSRIYIKRVQPERVYENATGAAI